MRVLEPTEGTQPLKPVRRTGRQTCVPSACIAEHQSFREQAAATRESRPFLNPIHILVAPVVLKGEGNRAGIRIRIGIRLGGIFMRRPQACSRPKRGVSRGMRSTKSSTPNRGVDRDRIWYWCVESLE